MPDEIAGGEIAGIEPDAGGNTLTVRVHPRLDGVPLGTFLRAIGDLHRVLKEVDQYASGSPRPTLEWVMTSISFNSPLTLQLIGRRIENRPVPGRVADIYLRGLADLENGREPPDFSESAMVNAKDIALSTMRDGIHSLEFSTPGLPAVTPTRKLVENVDKIINKRYYKEESMIEGRLETFSVHGSLHFVIYDVLTNRPTRGEFGESLVKKAMDAIGKRVSVEGLTKYTRAGWPVSMEVKDLTILRETRELPQFKEGEGIDITGGIESAEYVRRLRDAE